MQTVTGVFLSSGDAERAAGALRGRGFGYENMNLLAPGQQDSRGGHMDALPTTAGEQPGMGRAVGSVVGGAVGAAGGMHLGMIAASLFVPGVGPIVAMGLSAAALAGAGGALAGGKAGSALEEALAEGVPRDEIFVYEDALRQGRTVLMVQAADDQQAEGVRVVMAEAGAESLDAARENWWLGLRSAEQERYVAQGGDFEAAEPIYRLGFEAALLPASRGRSLDDVRASLPPRFAAAAREEAFKHGYERGREYYDGFVERSREAA